MTQEPAGGFWTKERGVLLKSTFRYETQQLSLDRYLVVEPNQSFWVNNWLECFDEAKLRKELETAGFADNQLFGDVAGNPFDPAAIQLAFLSR